MSTKNCKRITLPISTPLSSSAVLVTILFNFSQSQNREVKNHDFSNLHFFEYLYTWLSFYVTGCLHCYVKFLFISLNSYPMWEIFCMCHLYSIVLFSIVYLERQVLHLQHSFFINLRAILKHLFSHINWLFAYPTILLGSF